MSKKSMAKEVAESEQMDLIDTKPENAEEIVKTAKQYKEIVARRMKLTDKEVELKQRLLQLLEDGHVQRLEQGKRKLKVDGFIITTEPKEESVKVKEVDE